MPIPLIGAAVASLAAPLIKNVASSVLSSVLKKALPSKRGKSGLIDTVLNSFNSELTKPKAQQDPKVQIALAEAETEIASLSREIAIMDGKSNNPIQKYWRPAIGWCAVAACLTSVMGLGTQVIFECLEAYRSFRAGLPVEMDFDWEDMKWLIGTTLGAGMGVASLRSVEKIKGSA